MSTESENPFEPIAEEKPEEKKRPKAQRPFIAIRRSRWARGESRDSLRRVPGFTRDFGGR